MKRRMTSIFVALCLMIALPLTAFATARANFTGKIWTGKPTILGLGYYCTAARNDSTGNTTHKAKAWSCDKDGKTLIEASASNNDSAVANSGKTKPNSGFGTYWEEDSNGNKIAGCVANASFTSDAYS